MSARAVAPPSMDWQASLFGDAEPAPDFGFATVERTELDDGAWVDVASGWMSGADTLFERLLTSVPWQERGADVREGRARAAAVPLVGQRRRAGLAGRGPGDGPRLHGRYGVRFDALGANLYRDGRDSVAPGTATAVPGAGHRFVAVLSPVGASAGSSSDRRVAGRASASTRPPATCWSWAGRQRTWQHSVPKVAHVSGPRISVSLRHRGELIAT